VILITSNSKTYSICEGYDGYYTDAITYGGCVIEFTYCYRVNDDTGLHEIAITCIIVLFLINAQINSTLSASHLNNNIVIIIGNSTHGADSIY